MFIKRLSRNQKGFTLIELLVVVAIIALLATFAVPKLFEAINKSKAAPGQADMQTISGALDRMYLDSNNNTYPTGTSAQVMDALKNGYLKSTTKFLNGYKQPYLYGTSATGSGYILIDLAGANVAAGGTVTVTCTAPTQGATANPYTFTMPAASDPQVLVVNSTIADADLRGTCTVNPATAVMIRN